MLKGFTACKDGELYQNPDLPGFCIIHNCKGFYWDYNGYFEGQSDYFQDFSECLVDFIVYAMAYLEGNHE